MTNTDQLARECAEKLWPIVKSDEVEGGLEVAAAVNGSIQAEQEAAIPIIAATLRPVVEERDRLREDHAAINAERAEARTIRDEMIRVQDANTQLRAEVERLKDKEKTLKEFVELGVDEAAQLRATLDVAEWALSESAEHDLSDKTAYRVSEALARIAEGRKGT